MNADLVNQKEHEADLLKREIRNQLTRSRRLPFPRSALYELLWHQDQIADLCQDAALLMALRRPELGIALEDAYRALAEAVSRIVHAYGVAIEDFDAAIASRDLREAAEKIAEEIDRINQLEHESDLVERRSWPRSTGARTSPFDRYHLIQLVLMLGGSPIRWRTLPGTSGPSSPGREERTARDEPGPVRLHVPPRCGQLPTSL